MIETEYIKTSRTEMLEFITNYPKKSLEIGCREGLFSNELKKIYNNLETWGIEPDERIKISDTSNNLDIFIKDFFPSNNTELLNQKFDLIIFNDVLEHMYDPWLALESCKKLLNNGGIVIASLPNVRHKSILKDLIFNDDWTYKSSGILDITHIRFFTVSTMKKLFNNTGFEIEIIKPLKSKQKLYKKILKSYKEIFHFLTRNKFSSIRYAQYGITARIKNE